MAIIEREFLELTKDLDPQAFWEENALCMDFGTNKPRASLSFSPDDHWLFEFLQVESTLRYYEDKIYRDSLHKEANQVTLEYVGKAFFSEDTWEHDPRRIENLFGCYFTYAEHGTPWLTPVTRDPKEFERVLDQAEETDIREWALPKEYLQEWNERKAAGKPLPKLGTGSRGPATIMTSILDADVLFYWVVDHPKLIKRFSELLAVKMVEFNTFLREFSGNDELGWWITDDNCAFFSPRMYIKYCYPVLDKVLNAMAPGEARRYQHSDSSMGHLIDMQYALGIRSVNYGPEVDAGLIREKMPDAIINGQMPPMLLRNGSAEEIRERFISDFEKAGASGGLNIATAGSLAAGTGVGRMRYFMWLAENFARYDR